MTMDVGKDIFLAGWIVLAVIRVRYRLIARGVPIVVNRKDARELMLLAQLAVGMVVVPALYVFTPLLDFANYHLPTWTAWLGAIVLAGALWLFWRSHAALRENFSDSLQLRQGHRLITSGVYARIRHPMYAGAWLWAVAQVLLLTNWLAGWSSLPTFGLLYFLRAPREEQMMLDQFGAEYQAYMDRTGRVIPHETSSGRQHWFGGSSIDR